MRTYRCSNGCSVSDEYKRCKKCDSWLKYDGDNTEEEVEKKTADISMEGIPSSVHLPKK